MCKDRDGDCLQWFEEAGGEVQAERGNGDASLAKETFFEALVVG